MRAARQTSGDSPFLKRVDKQIIVILGLIRAIGVFAKANLSALDIDLRVAFHMSVQAAAIHRAFHKGITADGHLGFAHGIHQVEKG